MRPHYPFMVEVGELGPQHHHTGLVYPNGQPIIKVTYPEPIGFVHFPDIAEEPDAKDTVPQTNNQVD